MCYIDICIYSDHTYNYFKMSANLGPHAGSNTLKFGSISNIHFIQWMIGDYYYHCSVDICNYEWPCKMVKLYN